ncbi:Chaperonin Cpn60/TCP-1 [Corchorus olitorius]|uniref:Chaperonin Cpn60/TCP-1 n=1 Tax=Corchorus olitorius TaxID=93759 RepID=A0A1R3HP74_9ROSI|nr:Chaperonin Cpn60/TCP-1 [Corchorus olitorius]
MPKMSLDFTGMVIRDDMGLTLDRAGKEVVAKDSTYIVRDGNTREAVQERVSQIERLVEVGAQIQVELKDKQLRIEDALNATKGLSNNDTRYGYNAASNTYEDLVKAGIMDPTKIILC